MLINKFLNNKLFKYFFLLFLQILAVLLVGLFSKDEWYVIIVAIIGVLFNFFVSINKSYGFLFGVIYAIFNGVISYFTGLYATFGFMIIMQAPMAVYSFFVWNKNRSNNGTILKVMNIIKLFILIFFMIGVGVAGYFLLNTLNGSNKIYDIVFFVFSVSACVLLALRYRLAYIITLLSGLGGVVLYTTQYIVLEISLSLAFFYIIVSINSIIAVYNNYFNINIKNN